MKIAPHKAFCLNTSELFLRLSIAADFIDSRLLADSHVEGDRLVNALGRYRVLVVPYGLVMPRAAFAACQAFGQAGGRIVFVGTPVACDEQGDSLSEAFADLLGVPVMKAEHYLAGLDAVCRLPEIRPQRLEVCRPLPADWPRLRYSIEGEPHAIASPAGNMVFLSDLDPGLCLIVHLEDRLTQDVKVWGENVLWRLYRGTDGKECLVLATGTDRPLRGIVHWAGQWLEITAGSVGLFEYDGNDIHAWGDLAWRSLADEQSSLPGTEISTDSPLPLSPHGAAGSFSARST